MKLHQVVDLLCLLFITLLDFYDHWLKLLDLPQQRLCLPISLILGANPLVRVLIMLPPIVLVQLPS